MNTTVKKLQLAIKNKFLEKRNNNEAIDMDFLLEIKPMLEIANLLSDFLEDLEEEEEEEEFPMEESPRISTDIANILDSIQQKLTDCEKNYKKWISTKNEIFKEMAKNSLRDCEKLIAVFKKTSNTDEDKKSLQNLINMHNIYLAKLI